MDHPRPLVVAHRGASSAVPEHTLASYTRAVADGADALECDVRLTRDAELVCCHDRRLDRTSTGRGALSRRRLADLAAVDFGRSDTCPPGDDPDHRRVLTLERLVQLVLDEGDGLQLHVETKHPTRHGSRVERELVRLLERYGLADPGADAPSTITVMSFSPRSLRCLASLAPRLPRVLLMHRVPARLADGRLPRWADAAGPSLRAVLDDPGYPARVQRAGGRVHVWTVNAESDVAAVQAAGVDAVITDRPGPVRGLLAPAPG